MTGLDAAAPAADRPKGITEVGMVVLLGGLVCAHAEEPKFPTVTLENLLDQRQVIPDQLPTKYTVIVLAFFQRQQAEVDTWLPSLEAWTASQPDVAVMEIPVVSGVWRSMNTQVLGLMKAGITDPEDRRRIWPFFGEAERFLAPLGLTDTEQIVVALVTADGRVAWLGRGRATRDALAELRAAAVKP